MTDAENLIPELEKMVRILEKNTIFENQTETIMRVLEMGCEVSSEVNQSSVERKPVSNKNQKVVKLVLAKLNGELNDQFTSVIQEESRTKVLKCLKALMFEFGTAKK